MDNDRLVAMANQIAIFFRSYPMATAVEGVADHIVQFWDPRMRARLVKQVAQTSEGVDPLVAEAVARVAALQDHR
jgi:formate dehydrogenase subunit delta